MDFDENGPVYGGVVGDCEEDRGVGCGSGEEVVAAQRTVKWMAGGWGKVLLVRRTFTSWQLAGGDDEDYCHDGG